MWFLMFLIYSVPVIMKGYIARIISVGKAYGGGNASMNKNVLPCTTGGAPQFLRTES